MFAKHNEHVKLICILTFHKRYISMVDYSSFPFGLQCEQRLHVLRPGIEVGFPALRLFDFQKTPH